MTDLAAAAAEHRGWIEDVCARLGVAADAVDVQTIHGLTGAVAERVARPMAPVTAFVAGLAVGAGSAPSAAFAALRAAFPAGAPERRPDTTAAVA